MKKRITILVIFLISSTVICSCNTESENDSYTDVDVAVAVSSSENQNKITFNTTDDTVVISNPIEDTIEDFPYYYKEDYNDAFGDGHVYEDGNLVTCLSMIETYYNQVSITPDMFLVNHSDICKDGTVGLNSEGISTFIEEMGLGCVETEYELKTASDSLKTLHGCILVYIPHNSVYGEGGSYLLITGIYEDKFIIHDPSRKSESNNIAGRENNQVLYNATTLTASASKSSKMWIIY